MKKRPISLVEVMIGIALTALLLTVLFSSFRELMQMNSQMAKMRQDKQWEYVLNVRLNQIFEGVRSDALFMTEPYRDISPKALHFVFDHGLDSDPKFCRELEGFLFVNKDNELCLILQSKEGKEREEVFAKNCSNYSMQFFDPLSKKWKDQWDLNYLPPIVKISIASKHFQFVLPHANRMVLYP